LTITGNSASSTTPTFKNNYAAKGGAFYFSDFTTLTLGYSIFDTHEAV
jgi:predicted outer membrane repeat protein